MHVLQNGQFRVDPTSLTHERIGGDFQYKPSITLVNKLKGGAI